MTTGEVRPRMKLLGWELIRKGALIGRAKIRLPNNLEISDVGIFAKDGRRWAQLPAQMMRDRDGQPITDDRGKARYVSSLRWASKDLQERFSEALIAVIEEEHGPLGSAS